MAKKSAVERDGKRRVLVAKHANRRAALKQIIMNRDSSPEDRFEAVLKLAEMSRNGAEVRVHNRCEVTGRPRGYYRKFRLGRVMLRELASKGQIPGMVKSSW
jgi:small subunit ribosomal protein S14